VSKGGWPVTTLIREALLHCAADADDGSRHQHRLHPETCTYRWASRFPGGDWVVRVYHKPFVDWIWGGAFLMALGGVIAITDRRYRLARREQRIPSPTVLGHKQHYDRNGYTVAVVGGTNDVRNFADPQGTRHH